MTSRATFIFWRSLHVQGFDGYPWHHEDRELGTLEICLVNPLSSWVSLAICGSPQKTPLWLGNLYGIICCFFVVSLSDPKKYYFDESLESHVLRPTWTFWNKVEKHKNHIIVCFHGDSRLMDYGHPQYAKGSKNLEQVINESTNIRVFKLFNSQLPNIDKSWQHMGSYRHFGFCKSSENSFFLGY